MRKAVAERLAEIPLDTPNQAQQPRAAALISEEEAMSASGAAALDEARDLDLEQADDEDQDRPFTEEEVEELLQHVRAAITEAFTAEESSEQVQELEAELAGKDLQERGSILLEVMEYLNNPEGEGEGGEEGEEGQEEYMPYEGEEALEGLWTEVVEMCNEEDVPALDEELRDKPPDEQWRILLEVRDYLINGDAEEQAEFNAWEPSPQELEGEWKVLIKRVPKDDLHDLQEDWLKADADERKKMVWDVRKFIEQQDADEAEPRQPPGDAVEEDAGRKNEMRRRGGARRGADYEYNYELDADDKDHGGDWDDYYSKESKGARKGQRSYLLVGGVVLLLGGLATLLTATVMAEEDEAVMQSAMRLLRLS